VTTRLAGATVLLTGASSGIGAATAPVLAERGATLAVTARRAERLEALVASLPGSGHVAAMTMGDVEDVLGLNYLAPVRMTLATLPAMLEQGSGCQVYVSSLGGRVGIPAETAYCASKFALAGWAEAMAVDLWDSPVDVRLVIPGAIDTEIWSRPGNDPAHYDGPLEPPSTVSHAIADAIEGDAFEVYAPDLRDVVKLRVAEPDTYLAGVAGMAARRR
jgi:short-subunit dehydrogenase